MLKIALYLNDDSISIDLPNPELGNPGIGGTQFNFITLPYYFNQHFPGEIKWYLITYRAKNLPQDLEVLRIGSKGDLNNLCLDQQFDYFIWKPASDRIPELLPTNQKCIAWIHNIPSADMLAYLANDKQVIKAVFAGHEVLDILRDHKIILKATVIFNGFDPTPYTKSLNKPKDTNLVVFLGSIVPTKYFHLLARSWKNILSKAPQAKLVVIGSGHLYGKNINLGPLGIAEETYENEFLSHISDDAGQLLPSVKFLGLLGHEKIDYLKMASVGVINPHGNSEVCPGSAIEFQACKTPVVAGGRYGNLDTVVDGKTGYLVKNEKELVNRVVNLLNDPKLSQELGENGLPFITDKFSQEQITKKWLNLFEELALNKKTSIYPMKRNWFHNLKFIFEGLRILKFRLGIFKNAPSIYEYIDRKKR